MYAYTCVCVFVRVVVKQLHVHASISFVVDDAQSMLQPKLQHGAETTALVVCRKHDENTKIPKHEATPSTQNQWKL